MIEAQAVENELIRQHHDATAAAADTVPGAAERTWRPPMLRLNAPIAGLMAAAAIGVVVFFLQVGMRQPHPVSAGNDPSKANPPAVASVGAAKEPVLRVEEPGGSGKPGVEAGRATGHGMTTGSIVAAQSDEPRVAPPVAPQPIEAPASDAEKGGGVEPEAPSSSQPTQFDTTAAAADAPSEALPQAAPSQPLPGKAELTTGPGDEAVATRSARIISPVNMRAGPGNDQPVVGTIPGGSPVQVVKCRHWCEVIFAGQQGWVYKSFVGTSPTPGRP